MQNIKFLNVDVGKTCPLRVKRDVFDNTGKKIGTKLLSFFALLFFSLWAPCYGVGDGDKIVPVTTSSSTLTTTSTTLSSTYRYHFSPSEDSAALFNHLIHYGLDGVEARFINMRELNLEFAESIMDDYKKWEDFIIRDEDELIRNPYNCVVEEKNSIRILQTTRLTGVSQYAFMERVRPFANFLEKLNANLSGLNLPSLEKAILPKYLSQEAITQFVRNHTRTLKSLAVPLAEDTDIQNYEGLKNRAEITLIGSMSTVSGGKLIIFGDTNDVIRQYAERIECLSFKAAEDGSAHLEPILCSRLNLVRFYGLTLKNADNNSQDIHRFLITNTKRLKSIRVEIHFDILLNKENENGVLCMDAQKEEYIKSFLKLIWQWRSYCGGFELHITVDEALASTSPSIMGCITELINMNNECSFVTLNVQP